MLQIVPIPALKDNYIWLIIHTAKQQAIVVDPGEASPVLNYLQQQQLACTAILVTHHHADHTQGIAELKRSYDVPVIASGASKHPLVTRHIEHQQTFTLFDGDLTFQGIAIPGHTLDHMAFYSTPWAFTGDTLFSAGCGRVFEGTPAQMWQSLQTLLTLPEATQIYCGHEYTLANLAFAQTVEPHNLAITQHQAVVSALREGNQPSLPSTLALEKSMNPFLRVQEPAVIQAVSTHVGQILSQPVDVFAALREWKNQF